MPAYGRFANGIEYGRFGFNRRANYGPSVPAEILDLVFGTREDAEKVLDQLETMIKEYGATSVSDLYVAAGVSSSFADTKWGWTDLIGFAVRRVREGFLIEVPRPKLMDLVETAQDARTELDKLVSQLSHQNIEAKEKYIREVMSRMHITEDDLHMYVFEEKEVKFETDADIFTNSFSMRLTSQFRLRPKTREELAAESDVIDD